MNKVVLAIASPLVASALAGSFVCAVNIHQDVQMLKAHSHKVDADLRQNREAAQEFIKLMTKMDSTLEAHRASIDDLKEAIKRLEAPRFAYYTLEVENDS